MELMKKGLYFLACWLWIFFLGCGHLMQNPSLSPDSGGQKTAPTATPQPTQGAEFNRTANIHPLNDSALDDQELGSYEEESTVALAKKSESVLDEALDLCQVSQEFWQKGELENALDALDQAYALILKADTSDHTKLIQQKEDLRFMISKRILEIYASRNIVVNGSYNAIPRILNKHVQAEIDRFTGHEREFFIQSYQRSGRYRQYIVAALKEAGLPEELSWLPLIESGFKVRPFRVPVPWAGGNLFHRPVTSSGSKETN